MINDLLGMTLSRIDGLEKDSERATFTSIDGREWIMHHVQDCCESVSILDIDGDVNDLLNTPITLAEESSNSENPPADWNGESFTWTFYRLGTNKGIAVIRWYGTSNGFYSEQVDFEEVR
jgi:hypothetical protein